MGSSTNYSAPHDAVTPADTACLMILRVPTKVYRDEDRSWDLQVEQMKADFEAGPCAGSRPDLVHIWGHLKSLDLPEEASRIAVFVHDSVEGVYALDIPFTPGLYVDPWFDIREVAFQASLFAGFYVVQVHESSYSIYLMESQGFFLPVDVEDLGRTVSESWVHNLDQTLERLLEKLPLPVIMIGDSWACATMRRICRNSKHMYAYLPGLEIKQDTQQILDKMHNWMEERNHQKLAKVARLLEEEAAGKRIWKGSQAWLNSGGLSRPCTMLVSKMLSKRGSRLRRQRYKNHAKPVLSSRDELDTLLQRVRSLSGHILFYDKDVLRPWDSLLIQPGKC